MNTELRTAIYNYAKSFYPDINFKILSKECTRVANKVTSICCDAQSSLTIIGILLSVTQEE